MAASRIASSLSPARDDPFNGEFPPANNPIPSLLNVRPAKRSTPRTETLTIVRGRIAIVCEPRTGALTVGDTGNLPEVFHRGVLACKVDCADSFVGNS